MRLSFRFDVCMSEILYKFRDWDVANHRKVISMREVFFASRESLNDPFDNNLPLLDVESDFISMRKNHEIKQWYESTRKQIDDFSDFKKNPLIRIDARKNILKWFYKDIWIFSISTRSWDTKSENPLLMSHLMDP